MESQIIQVVTIVLGIFLYNNEYDYMIIIGIIILSILNAYFILRMIGRIVANLFRVVVQRVGNIREKNA